MRKVLIGLAIAALIGSLLDLGVFGVQIYQYGRINGNSAQSACWDGVLDQAVTGTPTRAFLIREARACAKLGNIHPPDGAAHR